MPAEKDGQHFSKFSQHNFFIRVWCVLALLVCVPLEQCHERTTPLCLFSKQEHEGALLAQLPRPRRRRRSRRHRPAREGARAAERGIHTLRLDDGAGPVNSLSRLNAVAGGHARVLVCKRRHAIVLVRIGATSWYVLDSEQPFALGQAPQPLKAVTDQAYHRNVTSDPVLVYGLRP